MAHPNETLVRKWLDSLAAGNIEAARDSFTDDVSLHFPGRNPLAGDYRGRERTLGVIRRASELVGASFEVEDVLANDNHVVALANMRIERDNRVHACRRITVYTMQNGKIAGLSINYSDQELIDELASVYEAGAA